MIEDSYVRLYAHDFVQMAGRSELGQDVQGAVDKRLADARAHAVIMDARKGPGHLNALVSRLRDLAPEFSGRVMLKDANLEQAGQRRLVFLNRIADALAGATAPLSGSRLIAG